jgi:hypothetical protein
MAYGVDVGGSDMPRRKKPKKAKTKPFPYEGKGSAEMKSMLKKAYKGRKPKLMLGQ